MKDEHCSQLDAAKFWIEAAHRLGFNDPDLRLTPERLDDAFRRLHGPHDRNVPSQGVSPMLIRFLYTFEDDLGAFIDDYLDHKLDPEGQQIAALLIDAWPGLPALIAELRAIQQDYRNSPHYHRMVDLIRNWDFDASREENVARHHLRMTTPKTKQ